MNNTQTLYLAGGCYWGMEELFRTMHGVTHTQVGFSGGHVKNAAYREVTTGTTGHAETLKIEYDSNVVSLRRLLFEFFRIHNPTKINQQGNDIGTQYRSIIFFSDEEQKNVAAEVINKVDESGLWGSPVVTEVIPFEAFYPAEQKHQKYIMQFPDGYTCHFKRNFDFGENA
jgi:methionine-S-sulfoxide reductase